MATVRQLTPIALADAANRQVRFDSASGSGAPIPMWWDRGQTQPIVGSTIQADSTGAVPPFWTTAAVAWQKVLTPGEPGVSGNVDFVVGQVTATSAQNAGGTVDTTARNAAAAAQSAASAAQSAVAAAYVKPNGGIPNTDLATPPAALTKAAVINTGLAPGDIGAATTGSVGAETSRAQNAEQANATAISQNATAIGQNATAIAARKKLLTPVGPQNAAYTANPWELVQADISAGSFVLTLPPAQTAWEVVVKVTAASSTLGSTNVALTPQGSDTLNGGTAAIPLRYVDQSKTLVSDGNGHITVSGGDMSKTITDQLYLPVAPSGTTVGASPAVQSDGTVKYKVPPAALGAAYLGSTGDLTDRTAAINAAISSLGSAGGVVKLGPGPFGVTSTIVVPGGVWLQGSATDLGADSSAPACGSWLIAVTGFPVDTTSAVLQLGQDASQFVSGYTGASADHVIVDAAGIAATAIKTFGRRTYTNFCQAWRGTVTSLVVAGQNSYVIDTWSSGNNACRPMLVSGSDSKIVRNQIREAGPNLPQVEITGLNVEFGQNHVYGGSNGSVSGTGPSDNLLIRCPAQADVGHWRINDNTFDGTNGNHIHVIVSGAARARDILINGNTFYNVTGMTAAAYYPLKVDVSQCTYSFSIRELVFTNNTVNGNVTTLYWRALVGFYGKASPNAVVERFLVDGNMGSNAPLFTEGYTMRIDGSCGTTSGSPTVTDTAITAADAGMPVTGPGIPPNTFVGPAAQITAGASFNLSASPTSYVAVNATATATVSVNVGVLNASWRPDFLGENNGLYINNTTSTRTGSRGMAALNGTGSQTAFTINHGLGFTPTWWDVTLVSAAAAAGGAVYVTASSTTLTVTFATAPASGTANVSIAWRASL